MNKNNSTYNGQYNKTCAGRLRTQKQYHFSKVANYAEDKRFDTFTPAQLEKIWNNQKGICPCCNMPLKFEDADISHISKSFFFKASNFQLLHAGCNKAQAGLTMPFMLIKEMYGQCFLDLLNNYPEWTFENLLQSNMKD